MILSDRDIKKALKDGRIQITPKPDLKVQLDACMIDLHLGSHFRVFKHSSYPYIDLKGKIGGHILRIEFLDEGDRVYAFTFG